ncbi:MAG: dUTP diphosphatase [Proteobacteria bacterium]|nr:dUTP diphosphatase [Pseudomonadota bacterium]
MSKIRIEISRLPHGHDLPRPAYQTIGSAGMDLAAAVTEPLEIAPGARTLVATGFMFVIPAGYEAQIRPRSGLALKHGVTVLNAPGTVDSDYRGEVSVVLVNHGAAPFTVNRGDRIAQMVIAAVARGDLAEMETLPPTARGARGYGSTGSGSAGSGANEA